MGRHDPSSSFPINLNTHISDLKLSIKGTWLDLRVRELKKRLKKQGLRFLDPVIYLGDEWFSPDGLPAIAIPFFLASPDLMLLEKHYMHWVEGGTINSCDKLLNHEAGHCFDHAYGISKTQDFKRIFGDPQQPYDPDGFKGRPYSRQFVKHLDSTYAQTHPCEDFAETFAVLLTPRLNWRKKYRSNPVVLEKLQFVSSRIDELGDRPPKVTLKRPPRFCRVQDLSVSLERFYQQRCREQGSSHPSYYDRDLIRIGIKNSRHVRKNLPSMDYFSTNHEHFVQEIQKIEPSYSYEINGIIKRFQRRSKALQITLPNTREGRSKMTTLLVKALRSEKRDS